MVVEAEISDRPAVTPDNHNGFFLDLIVARGNVKTFKDALDTHDLLDKTLKITPFDLDSNDSPTYEVQRTPNALEPWSCDRNYQGKVIDRSRNEYLKSDPYHTPQVEQKYVIPTTFEPDDITRQNHDVQADNARGMVLQAIGFPDQTGVDARWTFRRHPSEHLDKPVLAQAVRYWLNHLPPRARSQIPADFDSLLSGCKWTYTIYSPMLLLPPTFLSKDPWPKLLERPLKLHLPELYDLICQRLKVTHIAINGLIPALIPNTSLKANSDGATEPNILRSPSNFTPLHGDFGRPNLPPRAQNLQDAFWISTVQNDITQTWAPMYTMFSRGNLSEKTRLLRLNSLRTASAGPQVSSAVDLYAGIGYFAFSYAKAGVDKILCWELNRWSIEGLKRGAEKNGWTTRVIEDSEEENTVLYNRHTEEGQLKVIDARFLVFHESNKYAAMRVGTLREKIPPVRHVNCGYLPSSRESWAIAMNALDRDEGGWIHAHENVAIKNIERRRVEVTKTFESLAEPYRTVSEPRSRFSVGCHHVERIKTYAPGVIHCVFDIAVLPRNS